MFRKIFNWLKRSLKPLAKLAKNRLWFEREATRNKSSTNIGLIARSRRWGARFSFTVRRKFVLAFLRSIKGFLKYAIILLVIWLLVYFNEELISFLLIEFIKKYCPHVWMSIDAISLLTTTTVLTVYAFWFAFIKLCKFLISQWSIRFLTNLGFSQSDLLDIEEEEEKADISAKNSWYIFKTEFTDVLGVSINNYRRFFNATIGLFGFEPWFYVDKNYMLNDLNKKISYKEESHEQRQACLKSAGFKEILLKWLEKTKNDTLEEQDILAKIFGDSISDVNDLKDDYSLFLKQMYKTVWFLETDLSIANTLRACEGLGYFSTKEQVSQLIRDMKFLCEKEDFITLLALFDYNSEMRLTGRAYTFLHDNTLTYIFASNIFNHVNASTMLWYATFQPVYFNASTINSFNNLLSQSSHFWFLLDQLKEDVNSRKWDRWAYKISALERHSISDIQRLQEIMRGVTPGFFGKESDKTNLWATNFWDDTRMSNFSNYYRLLHSEEVGSVNLDIEFCTIFLHNLMSNNISNWEKTGNTSQSAMWLLKRFMLNHAATSSTIRASFSPKTNATMDFQALSTKLESSVRTAIVLNNRYNAGVASPYASTEQFGSNFSSIISELIVQKYVINYNIKANPSTSTVGDIFLLLTANEFFTNYNLIDSYTILLAPSYRPSILRFFSAIEISETSDFLHKNKNVQELRQLFPQRWGLLRRRGLKRYNYFIFSDELNRCNRLLRTNSKNYLINDCNLIIYIRNKDKKKVE